MTLKGKNIGVAFTGSFCTYEKVFKELEKLAEEGANIQTIFSAEIVPGLGKGSSALSWEE